MLLKWLTASFTKRRGRMLGGMAGIAITIALLSAIGSFITYSGAAMTARAIEGVPVDWQIQLMQGTPESTLRSELAKITAVSAFEPVGYADAQGLKSTTGTSVQQTGAAKIVGISDSYKNNFPLELRSLVGAASGALITQQAAANLHVQPGDTVTIQRLGLPPVDVKIDGVTDMPNADSFFQAIGMPASAAPQAPPDNVLILPAAQWHAIFDPQSAVRPDTVKMQYHVRIAHTFPTDPEAAYISVQRLANNLEARIAGSGLVGNNIAARLDAVRADALYAKVLFLFLGLPGAILAVLLVLFIAASGEGHRKHEQDLLRIHGASTARIIHIQSLEAWGMGVGGVLVGILLAFLVDSLLIPINAATSGLVFAWIMFASLAGIVLALAAVIIPSLRTLRNSDQLVVKDEHAFMKPLWQRIYLDVIFLAISAIEFWRTASTGYSIVMAPEGIASVTVHYESFMGPLFLWIGGVLLALRLSDIFIAKTPSLTATVLRPTAGRLAPVVSASLSRDRRFVTRGILLVALALSFAISTSIFNTTYNQQAMVDAELTNGSDVTVTGIVPFSSNDPRLQKIAALPDIAGSQLMQHRFAYVGKDLQDMYGVDPSKIQSATNISNAFFANHNAQATLIALQHQKDGILISEETKNDFQLNNGDLINLRMQDARDNAYREVPFHVVGVVREFPTAPKDSFFVANADYIASATHNPAFEVLLLRAKGSPARLAAEVGSALGPDSIKISEIGAVQKTISSGITSVDLRGLTSLELTFAIILLASSIGLVLALGLSERRRNFAIMKMIGGDKRELNAFIQSETATIFVGGTVVGSILGIGIAAMLVKVLTGIFDPPPEVLAFPWGYIATLLITGVLAASAASALASHLARQSVVEEIRAQA